MANQNAKISRILIILAVIVLFEVFFHVFSAAQDLGFRIFNKPMSGILNLSLSFKARISPIFNFKKIISENQRLEKENTKLVSESIELNNLKKENEFLKKQFNLKPAVAKDIEEANIFWISRELFNTSALIDRGKKDNIKAGDLVVSGGDILAGRITGVEDNFSTAVLLTNPDFIISASVLGRGISGLVKPDQNKNLWFDLISPKENIIEGDILVTNGLDGLLPGLKLGRVNLIITNAALVVRKIRVEPFLNLETSRVLIIRK